MKARLLFAIVLLAAAFTMPIFAVSGVYTVGGGGTVTLNNCTYTCSTGFTGHAWASSAQACADGCRASCVSCVGSSFSTTSNNN